MYGIVVVEPLSVRDGCVKEDLMQTIDLEEASTRAISECLFLLSERDRQDNQVN